MRRRVSPMSKSIEQLKQLAATHSTDKLKTLVANDLDLAGQLSFSVPQKARRGDRMRVNAGEKCCSWGQDPVTGEWICLKWGPPC